MLREVILEGPFYDAHRPVINQLEYLDTVSDEKVYLYVNSPGGAITELMAIIDQVKRMRSPVDIIACGAASSCGAALLTTGHLGANVRRLAYPSTSIMWHEPRGGAELSTKGIKALGDLREVFKQRLVQIPSVTEAEAEDLLISDNYLTAEDALEMGLIDEIITA